MDAVARQQIGDERDTPQVLLAVGPREAEAVGEVAADLVPVQHPYPFTPGAQNVGAQPRKRRLARSRQTGEPQGASHDAAPLPADSRCQSWAMIQSGGATRLTPPSRAGTPSLLRRHPRAPGTDARARDGRSSTLRATARRA